MAIGFYPGCSLKGSAREYTESLFAVTKKLGIAIQEINDWNCCGATAAHNLNHELALSLPTRILALAEKQNMTEIVVPCAACYSRLATTAYELNENEELRTKISAIIDMPYNGNVQILNVLQFIEKYISPKLDEVELKKIDIKAACYYGCLLVRPHQILHFDRVEDPQIMDEVMIKLGANALEWPFKTECCGAGLSISKTDLVGKLSGKIVNEAYEREADAIIVACPMCHSNLDMRRPSINKFVGKNIKTPVIYITQAIGLALGIDEKELGMNRHFVPTSFKDRVFILDRKEN